MRRRGCLFGCTGVIALLLLVCALSWFVALPRIQDRLRDDLSNGLSTQVASQFQSQMPDGATLSPGTYTLSLASLEQQITSQFSDQPIDDFSIRAEGSELVLSVGASGQELQYRGTPQVNSNGDLELTGMSATNSTAEFFLPADKLGDALEQGVNGYIGSQGLQLQDVRVEGDQLVFDVVE